MNTGLKHWKEAATLILVAGRRLGAGSLSSGRPGTVASAPPVGDSRMGSRLPHRSAFDYDVLLLKRSSKSGFMPSAYVFPGGKVDASDFSREWLDIFSSFRNSPNFGLDSVAQPASSRAPIFATDRLKLGSPIPGEVALRICALRETFEESGVLLVVSKAQEGGGLLKNATDRNGQSVGYKTNTLSSPELTKWRSLVNQNPSNFIQMCRELEVLPNIWALHEWSNWLTPVGKYRGTRFDTAFFICCLEETPQTLQDEKEIVRYEWSTPPDVLQRYQEQEFLLPPPQFYELSRLCRSPSLNNLHVFASQRGIKGCECYLPVVCLKDGKHISLLPGDRLYPLDTSGTTEVDTSSDPQWEEDSSGLNRMVFLDTYNIDLQVTIEPKFNHILPFMVPRSLKPQSQL